MWDEIIYPLTNFNGSIEIWEWVINFIPYFMMDTMTQLEIEVNPC